MIGSIRLNDSTILEVAPKVDGKADWVSAVLDLLIGLDRIDVAGERLAGLAPKRPELLEVLASVYAARLQRAIGRDGPLLLLDRRHAELGLLKGKLKTSNYLIQAPRRPHRFPVSYDELSADNDYSRALVAVARLLASITSSPQVRTSLVESAAALRPGFAEQIAVDPSAARKPFPPQWAVYRPAWSIAVAILTQTSLLRATGQHHGVEIAIEPWPLLERLLERALDQASVISSVAGTPLHREPKHSTPLLIAPSVGVTARSVEPDGRLTSSGSTIATFEAKYSPRVAGSEWPSREHVFQALTTAAACHSPLAVLVFPEDFEPCWWDVQGFAGFPSQLTAIGLGLFSYRRGAGDRTRGERIVSLLAGRTAASSGVQNAG
ncbi:5-methylcytosine restriction system specificity protein McrC [Actinomarinicola tropica]|uniref:5-methylcytosine restriction system specificity protein McrC n=1 Tax=Actinomarinicola tropica TaxID=2789776 RepID=UPI00189A71FC|nr:hypothetical protein [Actinomarinicola tropica]